MGPPPGPSGGQVAVPGHLHRLSWTQGPRRDSRSAGHDQGGRLAKPDSVLVANILGGFQSKGSPMAMPAKGGNPNLTAEDAQALVLYMRTLNEAAD